MSCEYCRSYPHVYGCPNYTPSKTDYHCSICGEGIYEWDKYLENIHCEYAHYECLCNLIVSDVLEWLECEIKTMIN